jgi:hypothetical protein
MQHDVELARKLRRRRNLLLLNGAVTQTVADAYFGLGSGMMIQFAEDWMHTKDRLTPANDYDGSPNDKLAYTAPSPKLIYNSAGTLAYGSMNLALRSETFNSAPWVPRSTEVIAANTTAAPDGTLTADTITMAASAVSGLDQGGINTGLANSAKAAAIWAKVASGTKTFRLGLYDGTNNLLSSDFTATTTWQKFTHTGTLNASVQLTIFNGSGGGAGDLIVWGAQLNLGPTISPTYLPTTSAARYALPLDYDPITHEAKGVLIEEQRVNLLTQSQTLSTTWAPGGSSVTADAVVAPDGTTTADKIAETAVSSTHFVQSAAFTGTAAAYTATCYVKAAERSFVWIDFFTGGVTNIMGVFDLSAGTFVGNGGFTSATSASIQSVGNGWYRISITATLTAASWQVLVGCSTTSTVSGGYLGVAGSGFYAWGAQAELGAFPTSYVPTVASQVTRAADQVSLATSAFPFSQTAGTVIVNGTAPASFATSAVLWEIDNTTLSNRHLVSIESADSKLYAATINGTVIQANVASGSAAAVNSKVAHAYAYAANDFSASANGAAVATDVSGTPPAVSVLRFGCVSTPGFFLNGWLKSIIYLPSRASDADLVRYSEPTFGYAGGALFDFTTDTATIKDYTTPANSYASTASGKLTMTAPSPKMVYDSSGVLGYRLGAEKITTGDFSSSTGWTLSSATISGGTLNISAGAFVNAAQQSFAATGDKLVTFTVSGYVSGALTTRFFTGSNHQSSNVSANGTYSFVVSGGATADFALQSGAGGFVGSVDNLSVKPLLLPIDYDPVTHAVKGLLVEEQRTNLLVRSQEVGNAVYTGNNFTVTSDATTAPDGTTTAESLIVAAGPVATYRQQSVTITAAAYTWSIYVKPNGNNIFWMDAYDGSLHYTWFDLSAGTVLTNAAGNASAIQSVGNGWYRCTISRTSAGTTGIMDFGVGNADNSTFATGAGTTGIYVWGLQVEAGSFATSYIPTTSAQVTRAADQISVVASVLGWTTSKTAGTVRWYGEEGGIFASFAIHWQWGNANAERIYLISSGTTPGFGVADDNVAQALLTDGNPGFGVQSAFVTAWSANDFAMSRDGRAVVTDTAGSVPTPADLLQLAPGTFNNNGHLKSFKWEPRRARNTELVLESLKVAA